MADQTPDPRHSLHVEEHLDWDADGYCIAPVEDEEGHEDICGFRGFIPEPKVIPMNPFSEFIGYTVECSEPNGPRVVGFALDDWGQQVTNRFNEWLLKYEAALRKKIAAEKGPK